LFVYEHLSENSVRNVQDIIGQLHDVIDFLLTAVLVGVD
jgi:hypothetical protein